MSTTDWAILTASVGVSVVHYGYWHLRDRHVTNFLWRIFEASKFRSDHLHDAARAFRTATRSQPSNSDASRQHKRRGRSRRARRRSQRHSGQQGHGRCE
jgi:hypothetical protein